MLDLEKQMNEIKRENYIVHKDNDKLVRETQQLEKQLSQTVEFVNNINDEFEIARNKLRDYEQAAQLKALKRKRTSSNPNPNGNGESPKKEPSSPSTGNVILDSIIASPTSLLDGTFFVGGTYEKPPSEKYHVLVSLTIIIISFPSFIAPFAPGPFGQTTSSFFAFTINNGLMADRDFRKKHTQSQSFNYHTIISGIWLPPVLLINLFLCGIR